MLKKLSIFILVLSVYSSSIFGQIVNKPDSEINKNTNLILGFINPSNFSMHHSFKVSMLGSSYGNIAVTSYINTMSYKFSDKFSVSADIALNYSPYASSVYGKNYANMMQQDFTGVNLSRFSVDYKLSENSFISLEYRNMKNEYYDRYSDPFYGRNDPFYGR